MLNDDNISQRGYFFKLKFTIFDLIKSDFTI